MSVQMVPIAVVASVKILVALTLVHAMVDTRFLSMESVVKVNLHSVSVYCM